MIDALDKANDTPADTVMMQCCGLCDAWLATDKPDPRTKQRMGLCRALPPTPFLIPGPPNPLDPQQRPTMNVMAQFPPMPEGGWCREFDTDAGEEAQADMLTRAANAVKETT